MAQRVPCPVMGLHAEHAVAWRHRFDPPPPVVGRAQHNDAACLDRLSAESTVNNRTPEPFTAATLDEQLDEMIRAFLANPEKGMHVNWEGHTVTLSWILRKDARLFKGNGNMIEFVSKYVPVGVRSLLTRRDATIKYFDHHWTLNDVRQADD